MTDTEAPLTLRGVALATGRFTAKYVDEATAPMKQQTADCIQQIAELRNEIVQLRNKVEQLEGRKTHKLTVIEGARTA